MITSSSLEQLPTPHHYNQEYTATEYVSRFKVLQDDLKYMFDIIVPYENALLFPWVKDELYTKVIEGLQEGNYFSLDYMLEEGLLSRDDLLNRGIRDYKDLAIAMIQKAKDKRRTRAKELVLQAGILSLDEMNEW
jgi:hypothetical protein